MKLKDLQAELDDLRKETAICNSELQRYYELARGQKVIIEQENAREIELQSKAEELKAKPSETEDKLADCENSYQK